MSARRRRQPLTDHVPDVFASGSQVEDFDDWLRLVFWVETAPPGNGGDGRHRKVAAIAMPPSAIAALIDDLRDSHGGFHAPARRHS